MKPEAKSVSGLKTTSVAKSDGTTPETKRKAPSTAWVKGQSGNPGGMPKGLGEVKKLARQYTERAVMTLVEIMEDKEAPKAARVSAATSIIDRGWGKPLQQIEVGDPGDFSEMDEAEVDAFIAQAQNDLGVARMAFH